MKPGDRVILRVPENPRVDGQIAVVVHVEPWGAHTATDATATGRFRALFVEMEAVSPERNGVHVKKGFTGDCCPRCGSFAVVRTGTCATCQDCGESVGGCS